MMSGEPCNGRDRSFKDMLLAISKQLSEHDVEEIKYLTESKRCGCKPLELLTALRNKGMFSPHHCSPLEELLKKIDRHDLADDVINKFVALYPDQALPVEQHNPRRPRSATDPLRALAVSTPSDLDSTSLSSNGYLQGEGGGGGAALTGNETGSLGDVCNMYSEPVTPARMQDTAPGMIRSPPSGTSLRSFSQSSQGSCLSSNSSCASSYSSLHDAVLERTSAMLLDRVTANFTHHPSGLSRSFHGPHESVNPNTIQVQLTTSHTLPTRMASPNEFLQTALEPIQRPTISEIFSDPEEESDGPPQRRGTLECPIAVASRVAQTMSKQDSHDSNTLQLKRREKDVERSLTPRVTEKPADTDTMENILKSNVQGIDGDCTDQQTTKPGKEKRWCKRFAFFRQHRAKHSSGNSFTWRVHRDDLSKPIWRHDEMHCITRSHKFELDANLGRHNPKLLFQLYPYGESGDRGEYVTMIVRITTSDKCPPLPAASKVHVSLTVRADISGRESGSDGRVLNQCSIAEQLDLGYFRIHRVVGHDTLMKCHSKHIYFDIEATCSGVDEESNFRDRLSTL